MCMGRTIDKRIEKIRHDCMIGMIVAYSVSVSAVDILFATKISMEKK